MSVLSFLKAIGHETVKIVDLIIRGEQAAAPFVVSLDPALRPFFDVAGVVIGVIQKVEAEFAVVGQAANGPAKLQAAIAAAGGSIDAWIKAQLPGGAKIQDAANYVASKQDLVNALVKMLNSYAPTQGVGNIVATADAVIAAAAVKAAVPAPAQP